jgi:hypothetical protein
LHNDAEGPVGVGPFSQVPEVVECGDTEGLIQAASHGRNLLLWNHDVLLRVQEFGESTIAGQSDLHHSSEFS